MILGSAHELAFGTASLGGLYAPVSYTAAQAVLQTAWDAGLRYFDTAPHYGNGSSERRLGDFLRDKTGWVLSTKVGRVLTPDRAPPTVVNGFHSALPFRQTFDFTYDGVMRSFEDSIQRLGLDRIDILFVHDIGDPGAGTDTAYHRAQLIKGGGSRALSELKASGAVSAVGLGVNTVEICTELLGTFEIDLILLAGRYTLLEQSAAEHLFPLLNQFKVKLVIGGVFNSGILATGPEMGAHYNYAAAPESVLRDVKTIESICANHGAPMASAAIQYPSQNEHVFSTLIGTADPRQLLQNLEGYRQPLPPALWKELRERGIIR